MSESVKFHGFCSKTRRRFVVVADLDGSTLVWKHAYAAGNMPETLNDLRTPASHHVISTINVSAFVCPCCNARPDAHSPPCWHCPTCSTYHCMGTENGRCLGACGSCAHDPTAFRSTTSWSLKVANPNDF